MYEDLKHSVTLGYSLFTGNPLGSGKDEQSLNQVVERMGKIYLFVLSFASLNLSEVLCDQW